MVEESSKDVKQALPANNKIMKEDPDYIREQLAYLRKRNWSYIELENLEDVSWKPFAPIADNMISLDSGEYGDIIPISSTTGWIIYYEISNSSNPSRIVISSAGCGYGKRSDVAEEPHHETGEGVDPAPYASPQKQAFLTIAEILRIVFLQKWSGINVLNGERHLQWNTWALARVNDFPCGGFLATKKDEAKFKLAEFVLNHELHRFNSRPVAGSKLSHASDSGEDADDGGDE
ncbi:MAG: hypothetical protein H8E74_04095 [Gammaproteobacteria bacterium]|nr:hypothetical protein [Gammaproteobacteria bacterium]